MATTHSSRSKTFHAYAKRFQELKADLAQIEYFSKGTLLARMVRCGKPQCACGKDPSKRHGPYYEWTYKARGKTVTVRLAPEAAPFFRAAARQYRKLKTILNRMETLSRQVKLSESSPRTPPAAPSDERNPKIFSYPRVSSHSQVALQGVSHRFAAGCVSS